MKQFHRYLPLTLVLLLGATLTPSLVQGQTATMEQQVDLRPGWNAVFLEVDPLQRDIATLFAGIPVASIWRWIPPEDGARFIRDPAEGLDQIEGWYAWFPEARPESVLTNLFRMNANQAYLVRVEGSQHHQVTIEGRPRFEPQRWISDAFTLSGLRVSESQPPTFAEYFLPSNAHRDQPVYRLDADGRWQPINPSSTPIRAGEAYWIYTRGNSRYQGRLDLTIEQGDSLEFSAALDEMRVVFRNRGELHNSALVRRIGNNNLPVAFLNEDPETGEAAWPSLPTNLAIDIPAGEDVFFHLALVRRNFSASRMEQILEISDETGERIYLHVGGNTIQPFIEPGGGAQGLMSGTRSTQEQRSLAGLWVGEIEVGAVSESQLGGVEPTPVREPFVKRVLLHVDAAGQARLLKDVIQMWEEGTRRPSSVDPTMLEVDEPGRYVLITDRNMIGLYEGAALRGGQPAGLRYSTIAYDFPGDYLEFAGDFEQGGQVSVTIVLEPDFPTNPFLHRYHPDHDNLDAQFLSFRKEAYQVVREMRLILTTDDPLGRTPPGWGETILGGVFEESLTGLHRNTIFTSGLFRMRRVSAVPMLNQ
jgi:hypothetical protein